jgi:hypothetical protein
MRFRYAFENRYLVMNKFFHAFDQLLVENFDRILFSRSYLKKTHAFQHALLIGHSTDMYGFLYSSKAPLTEGAPNLLAKNLV